MHAWPEGLGFSKSVECTTGIISVCDPSVLWLSTDVSSPNVTPRATNAFITPLIHNSYFYIKCAKRVFFVHEKVFYAETKVEAV
jgi:hypothetical protein